MLIPIVFFWKWVRCVVLQKSAVEISVVRSAILKTCVVHVFRSGPQYLRSALWSFILDGYSVKWEVCIDLSEVRADRYQRSVDFRELHTDVWEVATDIQEGRSDV